jgi:hypothetical protein
MRPVAVIGVGKTQFGAFPERDLRSLAVEAGEKCLRNGHVAGGMRSGTVYTETVIYSAPEAFTKDAPYQTAIVSLEGGGRLTGRVAGDRVAIDDLVIEVEERDGVAFFRKAEQA